MEEVPASYTPSAGGAKSRAGIGAGADEDPPRRTAHNIYYFVKGNRFWRTVIRGARGSPATILFAADFDTFDSERRCADDRFPRFPGQIISHSIYRFEKVEYIPGNG